jgi:cell division protein FtsB
MACEINATLNRKELEALAACPERRTCYQCLLEEDCKRCNTRVWSNTAKTALALADMVERLEWSLKQELLKNYRHYCPICERNKLVGHAADCELAALLKKVRGEVMREGEERIVLYERDEMLKQIEALQQENEQLRAQLESLRCTSCGEIPAMVSTDDGQYCEKCAEELDAVEMIDLFNYHADVEALQQENEQLQAQVAQYRDAAAVLETVTEHLENCYGRSTPDTEKAREVLAAIDKIGGREDA